MARKPKLNEFSRAYIEAALWSSTDESTESGGYPLDDNYGIDDLAPKTLRQMVKDANAFYRAHRKDIRKSGLDLGRAGHDFWLNRNGHGSGFWDEKSVGPEGDAALDRLDKAAKAYGDYYLYIGDDGRVHGQ